MIEAGTVPATATVCCLFSVKEDGMSAEVVKVDIIVKSEYEGVTTTTYRAKISR
jgi:hypothetical protein